MDRYEQITFDSEQMSPRFAKMIQGDFKFDSDMTHSQRVMRLHQILKFYNMVIELGMLEHTGDWDWRITVVTEDHSFGTSMDRDGEGPWGDTFRFPENMEVIPSDYTDFFSRWHIIEVEEFPTSSADEPEWLAVAVDDILAILITEA